MTTIALTYTQAMVHSAFSRTIRLLIVAVLVTVSSLLFTARQLEGLTDGVSVIA
jgi:hypothetical protein